MYATYSGIHSKDGIKSYTACFGDNL